MENSIDNSNSKMEHPSVSHVSAGLYNVPSVIRSVISLFHFSGDDRQNAGIHLGSDGRGRSDKRVQKIHVNEEE